MIEPLNALFLSVALVSALFSLMAHRDGAQGAAVAFVLLAGATLAFGLTLDVPPSIT